ncbi:MAG: PD40 domain-containing protein [Saprospiraceae bacterium]|nr:PD40 domain-containing protein [Saprospiraceae bacterium]
MELLYFASNRGGGRGGMDIWYVTRNRAFADAQFSQPVNLGPSINTLGDEMTPYYDDADGMLYFSSNGHPGMGGFDIFKSEGDLMNWAIPSNAGVPYNSSADDYYYTEKPEGGGGFFASNRVFAGEKLSTFDDDIFAFRTQPEALALEGNVFDRTTGEALQSYLVSIIEISAQGQETLLVTEEFNTISGYSFQVLPNRRFRVEVEAPGYASNSYEFFTTDPSVYLYGQPLFLSEATIEPVDPIVDIGSGDNIYTPPVEEEKEEDIEKTPEFEEPMATYTSRGTASFDDAEFTTNAPRLRGVYYKVQIIASKKYDELQPRFDGVREVGALQTEYLIDRGLYRVLLASFFSESEAKDAQRSAESVGFKGAFIVKYEDGQRYGRVNLK